MPLPWCFQAHHCPQPPCVGWGQEVIWPCHPCPQVKLFIMDLSATLASLAQAEPTVAVS